MAESEQAPAYLPTETAALWRDGGVDADSGTLELGRVPAGDESLLVRLPSDQVHIAAEGVGSGFVLTLEPTNTVRPRQRSHAVVDAAVRKVEVHGTANVILTLCGNQTNVWVHAPGQLTLLGDGEAARTEVRAELEDDETLAVRTALEIRALGGNGKVKLAPADASEDNDLALLDANAKILLNGDLTVVGTLQGGTVKKPLQVSGDLACHRVAENARARAASIEVGDGVKLVAQEVVGPGSDLEAKGDISVQGSVQGTAEKPVTLRGGADGAVHLGGTVTSAHVGCRDDDGQLARVAIAKGTECLQVRDTALISASGNEGHLGPDWQADQEIKVTSQCSEVELLDAELVKVTGRCLGTGMVRGARVEFGPSAANEDDDELLEVEVSELLRAGAPARLTLRAVGDNHVRACVGSQSPPPLDVDVFSLPDNASYLRDAGRRTPAPSRLALRGDLVASVVGDCTVLGMEGVRALLGAGQLNVVSAQSNAAQVFAQSGLDLGGGVLTTEAMVVEGALRHGTVDAAEGHVRASSLEVVCLEARQLEVSGNVIDCRLVLTGTVDIEGKVTAANVDQEEPVLIFSGGGRVGGALEGDALAGGASFSLGENVTGSIFWTPEPEAELGLEGSCVSLVVEQADRARLQLGEQGHVTDLQLQGSLTVTADKPNGGKRQNQALGRCELRDQAHLTMDSEGAAFSCQTSLPEAQSQARLTIAENTKLTLDASARGSRLSVDGAGHLAGASDASQAAAMPAVVLSGGHFVLSGQFPRVVVEQAAQEGSAEGETRNPIAKDGVTTLTVTRDGTLHELAGDFRLMALQGRITGAVPHRWYQGRRNGQRTAPPSVPPRLRGVREPVVGKGQPQTSTAEKPKLLTGTLIGVDVTPLDFAEVEQLDALSVFSPAPGPLKNLASAGDTTAEKQAAAQKLTAIAVEIDGRAVSGSVRTLAAWAVARAHHRIAPRTEWVARWASRSVGYSHRPLPAAATFLSTCLALLGTMALLEPDTCPGGGSAPGWRQWPENLARLLGPPLGFLRLWSPGEAPVLVGCHPLWQALVTVVVILPLIFLIIAIRQYMASPVDSKK